MNIKETFKHIGENTKQVFVDFKNNVNNAVKKFDAAPGKEKAWVLVKTLAVAIACGIIAFGVAALLGSIIPIPFIAGFVIGGTYAFYRFAGAARGPDQIIVDQAIKDVKQGVAQVVGAVGDMVDEVLNPK